MNKASASIRSVSAVRVLVTLLIAAACLLCPEAAAQQEARQSFPSADLDTDALMRLLAESEARQYKPVGHSSVVFRMRTAARVTAAFKARSRALRRGYQYEVAAYRVAQLLGLDNVPPAVFRSATRREIMDRFHPRKVDRWPKTKRELLWTEGGTVPGAAIYWVDGLRSLDLESRMPQWQSWLRDGGTVPANQHELARDLSSMIVFDFLLGNWDRYSGGNMKVNADATRLVMRDHDRSFAAPLSPKRYDRLLAKLRMTERFSESLVRALLDLNAASLREALAAEAEEAPLLTDLQLAELLDRRQTVLSHVGALVEERGERAVLSFP
jgi:hypothetical protein